MGSKHKAELLKPAQSWDNQIFANIIKNQDIGVTLLVQTKWLSGSKNLAEVTDGYPGRTKRSLCMWYSPLSSSPVTFLASDYSSAPGKSKDCG